ncbi:MAG TPA: hypothetical protein VID48_04200 [Solirubrobacteraceae bacterium]|jgi:hypothetical protein
MLFDLRGRGRRTTVRVVYVGLALLMGVGLVGFGIGGGIGGGGLFNASKNEETGGASFSSQIEKQKGILKKRPNDVAAWAALINAQLHQAGNESYSSPTTGLYTSKGKELLGQVAIAWSHYLALDSNPSPELAQRMFNVFSEEGLDQPSAAVTALQIVIPTRPPSAALYGELAQYSYMAHNTREGDLASAKAVSIAPSAQRARLKSELAEIKKSPTGRTYTTTTNGKTYAVKKAPDGSYTGTQITTTPAPASGSSPSTVKIGGKTYPVSGASTTSKTSKSKSKK